MRDAARATPRSPQPDAAPGADAAMAPGGGAGDGDEVGGPGRALRWLLVARTTAALVLLGLATAFRLRLPVPLGTDPLFTLLAISFALIAFHAAAFRVAARQRWVTDVQLAGDAFVVSAAVWLTGGIDSVLVPLYVLPVVGAAVVHGRRGGLVASSLSIALYSGIIALQYFAPGLAFRADPVGFDAVALPVLNEALVRIALNGAGLTCVALLTGYLAERLRRADERLLEASTRIADLQAFNQCVIDSLTGGLATTDLEGRILTFNRAAEQITGWRAADARQRPVQEVLQVPAAFVSALVEGGGGAHARRIELEYRARHRKIVQLGLTAAPLSGSASRVGHLFTFQDITERTRREREVQAHKRLAALGEMAAGIAHEIRNPLASMAGSIQVLRSDLDLNPEQTRLMDIVLRESQRLNGIIRDFLAFARPQRRPAQGVDLARIVEEAATLLRGDTARHPAPHVAVRVAPDCWALGDEAQLRQVVWNLASNALNAMPGGGRLELVVEPAANGQVALTVRDEGVGIAAADLDRVFEPFRTSFPGGTGLGLPIVHRIVTDAGGSIELESSEGVGTTVRVLLPQGPAPAIHALSA